ncbi:conserved hypothetical protein [Chelatococcus asaccharovorans]|nr:conserved hypothetical protein [Chelatococcus asaccharovorans]CAH1681562.1 conserved hypothetical protein [Chelatococcus asaccharovorans]
MIGRLEGNAGHGGRHPRFVPPRRAIGPGWAPSARISEAFLALLLVLATPALAQAPMAQPLPPTTATSPTAPPAAMAPLDGPAAVKSLVTASATLTTRDTPIRSGLIWRVYRLGSDGAPPELMARSNDATSHFELPPGTYMLHASYGFASAMRRITLRNTPLDETLTVNAGALKVAGTIGDIAIPVSKLTFSVYLPVGNDAEGRLVVADAKPGDLIRLPEGSYRIVSTYGDTNAIMRSDLRVEAGKLTEATVNHRAATVTLKLVNAAGGEAFAGTAFSVLTPGGDVIREAIGAFPSLVLAEGDYVLIARHDGQVYTREFKVDSGLDKDIEIVAR